ncbi:hypothetical protein CK203_008182 [Vitis vinifera]|uniref:Uncharacterized protein n=1 Tax=Vitis vinifera TaxID=29760 RepID=A0A438KP63_VITVI|nr:hypothetical protein CK203_008182 [Vitis vinifera]
MGLLKKLEHCVVASRRSNVGEEDDLEKLGQRWAKSWELKGSLGLAKMEKGRVLLDFEDLEEARRVVSSGNRTIEGVQVGLDFWSSRSGCWTEEEKAKEIWVRLFGLPVSFWSPEILKKVGDECGGFITADEQTKTLGELQWARILVKGRGGARPSVLEVVVEEEVYEIALWWEGRPMIRRSSRQADGRCSSEVGGEESSRAEKRVTKGWVSVRLEDLHPSGDGTGGQRAVGGWVVSNEGRGPIVPSWTQSGAVHPLSPNASQKVLKGDSGPGLKSGVMGLKLKGVALSPDAGPSCRPDEVGCSNIGPVSTPNKGPSSKGYGPQSVRSVDTREGPSSSSAGQDQNISQKKDLLLTGPDPSKTHAPEPFVAGEIEDLRKLNGVVRISETDKALEEESTRYGKGLGSWGKRVLGISHLNSLNFDRTPGVESFGHSGDWNEGVWVDNTMWLTVYEGCVERSNGCREVGAKESSSAMERGILEVGAICDTQTERGMQEDKWEESDLAKFSQFLGFPTEGLEKEILKFLSQIRKRREKIHKRLGTGQRAPDYDCPMKMKILSWNVRGANDSSKRKVIKTFIRNQRVDVICIQETKIQAMSDNIARSIGSGRFLEWKAVNAEGASGGILMCWDKRTLEVLDWEEGQFTLSCRFRNVENGAIWIFTGVYGLFSKMEREALWDELGAIRGLWKTRGV